MIFPRAPLLWAVGLWVVPLNLAAALHPARGLIYGAAMLPLLAAAAWDAWRARRRLGGLRPVFPASVRFTLGRPAKIAFEVRGDIPRHRTMQVTLELPPQLSPAVAALEVRLQKGSGAWTFELPVVCERRGRANAGLCALEADSPLGFWTARRESQSGLGVRVYPGLGLRTGLTRLPESNPAAGMHRRRQAGKGREFDKLREYLHGDDYHDIHWKATAKRGLPVTKTFQVENTQQLYVVVDASRQGIVPLSSDPVDPVTGHAPQPLEYFLRTAMRLGMAAERQGDRYGLMVAADRTLAFLPAGKGKGHFSRYRDALSVLEAREESPDWTETFTALRLRLGKRAMIFFLCSLDEPAMAETFAEGVGLLSRRHLVSVVSLRSARLRPVFQGPLPDTDAETAARLADGLRLRHLEKVAGTLRAQGAVFKAWEPARLSAEAVAGYLEAKRRSVIA